MSRSKQKGTAFEVLIRDCFVRVWDDRIVRVAQAGVNDQGDLANFRVGGRKVAVECKNVAKMDLSGWLAEAESEAGHIGAVAGIVVHKRRGKGRAEDQYVTMTLGSLFRILGHQNTAGKVEVSSTERS